MTRLVLLTLVAAMGLAACGKKGDPVRPSPAAAQQEPEPES